MAMTTEQLRKEVIQMGESSTACSEAFERIWEVGGDTKELARIIIATNQIVFYNILDFIRKSALKEKGTWFYAVDVIQEVISQLHNYRWLHTDLL